ncbi:hypothetical protein [Undibacterium sp. TJN19]|uniref:hypothetical protein n=1 Tax=Undibacterium sp. TJN19 TaxID=3413055 RepID=UPI003BF3EF91
MNKISLRFAMIVGLAGMLCACAMAPYVEPQGGDVADIVMRISPALMTKYTLVIYDDAYTCTGEKQLVSDSYRSNVSATRVVAEKLVTFGYSEIQGRNSCQMNISFTPKANHVYAFDSTTKPGRCTVKVIDATDINQQVAVGTVNRTVDKFKCKPLN